MVLMEELAFKGQGSGTGVHTILTMPSLSGDPLQINRKKGTRVSSKLINSWKYYLKKFTTAMGLIMKLSANLNYLTHSPHETHTTVSVPLF